MPMGLDAYDVLRRVAANEGTFGQAPEVDSFVRKLTTKRLKAIDMDVASMRKARDVLGQDAFGVIVDNLTLVDAKAVLGRVDRNSGLATSDVDAMVSHLHALASGLAEPKAAAPRRPAKKPPSPPPPKETAMEAALKSKAMRAPKRR